MRWVGLVLTWSRENIPEDGSIIPPSSVMSISPLPSTPFPIPLLSPSLSVFPWQCSSPTPATIPNTMICTGKAYGLRKKWKEKVFCSCFHHLYHFYSCLFLLHIPGPSRQFLSFHIRALALTRGHCENLPTPGSIFIPLNWEALFYSKGARSKRIQEGKKRIKKRESIAKFGKPEFSLQR